MPNKNKTACKRRIRSQRRRNRTARSGGWSPFRKLRENLREASETRRRTNVPAKIWLSPRRWNVERKTSNLAIQRAAAQDARHNAATNHAAIDAMVHQLQENQRINSEIIRLNNLIILAKQRNDPKYTSMVARRDALKTQLKQLNTASNTNAAYSERPAPAESRANRGVIVMDTNYYL
jgi:hypothetical protein